MGNLQQPPRILILTESSASKMYVRNLKVPYMVIRIQKTSISPEVRSPAFLSLSITRPAITCTHAHTIQVASFEARHLTPPCIHATCFDPEILPVPLWSMVSALYFGPWPPCITDILATSILSQAILIHSDNTLWTRPHTPFSQQIMRKNSL